MLTWFIHSVWMQHCCDHHLAAVFAVEARLTLPFSGPRRSCTTSTSCLLFTTNAPIPTCNSKLLLLVWTRPLTPLMNSSNSLVLHVSQQQAVGLHEQACCKEQDHDMSMSQITWNRSSLVLCIDMLVLKQDKTKVCWLTAGVASGCYHTKQF